MGRASARARQGSTRGAQGLCKSPVGRWRELPLAALRRGQTVAEVVGQEARPARRELDARKLDLGVDEAHEGRADDHTRCAAPKRPGHCHVTIAAAVKLDVGLGFRSRNQAWNTHISPARTAVGPAGVGIACRSTGNTHLPRPPVACS